MGGESLVLEAVRDSLPMSVGLALSPLPVAAVLIALMTARARRNAPAFLVGWATGIFAVGFAVLTIPGLPIPRGEPTRLSGLLQIILGAVLLLIAARLWWRRPRAEVVHETPGLIARLEEVGMAQSSLIGFLLSAANPTNLVLSASGAAAIHGSQVSGGARLLALLVFTAIASVTVVAPIAAGLLARQWAEALSAHLKHWLIRNRLAVLVVLLWAFGNLLVVRGVVILAA